MYVVTTIETCFIKFYILVTQSFSHKPRLFYCIMYSNEQTVLFLIVETGRTDILQLQPLMVYLQEIAAGNFLLAHPV